MAKLLKITYKSNIIRFKLDEDPLQSRIYFLTFVDSPEMIFYQYKETCEVLPYYLKIGGKNIKDVVKRPRGIFLHDNIDVQIKILISEFPGDGILCIEKLKSHCANMIFSEKVGIIEPARK